MADPYAEPVTGVLRNRLGITDRDDLAAAEADITAARIVRLINKPVPGGYDLAHLQAIHKAIFGSIYPWAGQIRSVDLAKENTLFCRAAMISAYADDVLGKLARRNHLRGLDRETFVAGAAELYGDINALHPFREGNGRTQRAFLGQLAADAGFRLDWTGMDPIRNRDASIASINGVISPLCAMLDDLITPVSAHGNVGRPAPRQVLDAKPATHSVVSPDLTLRP